MTDINVVLQTAYNNAATRKDYLGVRLYDLFGRENLPEYVFRSPPCFFLKRELQGTANEIRGRGWLLHLKLYKGHYLEYTTKREFATIEDWMRSHGAIPDDVLFGYNKFDGDNLSVPLQQLIQYFAPIPDPMVENLTRFVVKLNVDGFTLQDNVLVDKQDGTIVRFVNYMEQ